MKQNAKMAALTFWGNCPIIFIRKFGGVDLRAMGSDKRDPDAKLKLLGGMVRLGTFSAKELALHANVKSETARAFAEDRLRDGTLVRVEMNRPRDANAKRSGRPENIYHLDASHRERILGDIARVRRSTDIVPTSRMALLREDAAVNEDFTPLALLESSITRLQADEFEDADERLLRLDQTRIRLAGAEADFRAMVAEGGLPETVEKFAVRLSRARQTLQLEDSRQPNPYANEAASGDADTLLTCSAVVYYLTDWSANIQVAVERARPTHTWISMDERPAEAAHLIQTVLLPCGSLMRKVAGWSHSERRDFGRDILHQLSAAVVIDDMSVVIRLAISAALVEVADAAEPLLMTLLRPATMQAIGTDGLELFAMALARLARPSLSLASPKAANACLFLLNREYNEVIIPILSPAALQQGDASEGKLLNRLARTLYDGAGLRARWQFRIAEGAIMRNLAWVLQAGRYRALQQHLPDLVFRDYGAALFKALISPASGALRIVDRNDGDAFIVSPGKLLVEQAQVSDEECALKFSKGVNDALALIQSESSWKTQYSSVQNTNNFLGRLGDSNRLSRIQGGFR